MLLRLSHGWLFGKVRHWGLRSSLIVALLGFANFWGFSSPNAFPKCCSIVGVDSLPGLDFEPSRDALDVRRLLGRIPYSSSPSVPSSWVVHPDRRVEFVLDTGGGDCATKSRALARILQSRSIDYSLVFIMDADEAETGAGHTVVECPVEIDGRRGVGIVDMLNASVLAIDGRLLSVHDLAAHVPLDIEFLRANERCRIDDRYFGEYLAGTVVGVSRCEEVNRYFDYMASTHITLGDERIEKVAFIATSLVLGIYPSVFMTHADIARLDGWLQFEIVLAHAVIWAVRLLALILAFDAAAHAIRWFAKRARPAEAAGRAR